MDGRARVFADGVRPEWAYGINDISSFNYDGVEDWLSKANYAWVSSGSNTHRIDISGCRADYTNALACEIARFSCATYESMLNASPPGHDSRSIGWMLVRHYYAIFYAAHALLRVSGKAVIFLSDATCRRMAMIGGQYLGMAPKVPKGTYLVSVDKSNKSLLEIECISAGNGGSHAELWKQFLTLMLNLENSIVLSYGNSAAGQNAIALMKKLRAQLCSRGKTDGSWPSMVRNTLNYKHGHGVWFPYKRTKKECVDLATRLEKWYPKLGREVEMENTSDELEQFADCCNVMAYFLTTALVDLSSRCTSQRKSFVDQHVLKMLRQHKLI